jgi:ribonuclease D
MTIRFHKGDLASLDHYSGNAIAVDTETMGLNPMRDRLCVVQISPGDGTADVIQIVKGTHPVNLLQLLSDPLKIKILHFARFDIAAVYNAFNVMMTPIYCTKIASKLVRTYTDRHGLKELSKELVGQEMNKQQQSSDWGAETLTPAQLDYAASDVLHLHAMRERLDMMLIRENRVQLAQNCFNFLTTRALLDLEGFEAMDIFAHT